MIISLDVNTFLIIIIIIFFKGKKLFDFYFFYKNSIIESYLYYAKIFLHIISDIQF